jgi:DNA processing protein
MKLSEDQKALVLLHLGAELTPRQAHKLFHMVPHARELLNPAEDQWSHWLEPGMAARMKACLDPKRQAAFDRLLVWARQPDRHCLTLGHERYPAVLRMLIDAPMVLYGQGDWGVWDKPALAIVGARRCSDDAYALAYQLAYDAASRGWCVVSGLARGIDTAAHQGALASGASGSTIAVMGCGLDLVYPAQNAALARQIVASAGLLLSEFSLGSAPLPRHFPQRNRLVAAIGRATVVVQAARRSGSMITARLAAEMGREVFAVPGRPTDPLSEGPHELIRQGAGLLVGIEDLWRALGLYDKTVSPKPIDLFTES